MPAAQTAIARTSHTPKPILQIFVRLIGAPNPLVSAAADRSSPIFTQDTIRGTMRYSSIFDSFPPPKRMPLIRMASPIVPYSSPIVGKKRNITDRGMDSFCGRCIRSIAAINSLTVVVFTRYAPIAIPGRNLAKMPQNATKIKFRSPVASGSSNNSQRNATAQIKVYLTAELHFFSARNKSSGTAVRTKRTTFIQNCHCTLFPPPPLMIIVAIVTTRSIFVRGSSRDFSPHLCV